MSAAPFWTDPRFRQVLLVRAERACADPLTRGRFDAEDLVSETLRRVVAAQNGDGAFRGTTDGERFAYLHAYMTQALIDLRREHVGAQKRSVTRETDIDAPRPAADSQPPGVAGLAADQTSPSQGAIRNEEIERVDAAIAALPDRQREAIVLQRQGLGTAEIAERMGETVPAVEGLLKRAIARLKRAFDPDADANPP